MGLTMEKTNELLAYLFTLKGWGIKNYESLIVEWIDEDGMVNWCDNFSWVDGYSKRCYRDTPIANNVLNILGWDRNFIKFIK